MLRTGLLSDASATTSSSASSDSSRSSASKRKRSDSLRSRKMAVRVGWSVTAGIARSRTQSSSGGSAWRNARKCASSVMRPSAAWRRFSPSMGLAIRAARTASSSTRGRTIERISSGSSASASTAARTAWSLTRAARSSRTHGSSAGRNARSPDSAASSRIRTRADFRKSRGSPRSLTTSARNASSATLESALCRMSRAFAPRTIRRHAASSRIFPTACLWSAASVVPSTTSARTESLRIPSTARLRTVRSSLASVATPRKNGSSAMCETSPALTSSLSPPVRTSCRQRSSRTMRRAAAFRTSSNFVS